MDLKQLYQDIILEHGKSPTNFGRCKKHTHEAKGYNPLCGDKVQIFLISSITLFLISLINPLPQYLLPLFFLA